MGNWQAYWFATVKCSYNNIYDFNLTSNHLESKKKKRIKINKQSIKALSYKPFVNLKEKDSLVLDSKLICKVKILYFVSTKRAHIWPFCCKLRAFS